LKAPLPEIAAGLVIWRVPAPPPSQYSGAKTALTVTDLPLAETLKLIGSALWAVVPVYLAPLTGAAGRCQRRARSDGKRGERCESDDTRERND